MLARDKPCTRLQTQDKFQTIAAKRGALKVLSAFTRTSLGSGWDTAYREGALALAAVEGWGNPGMTG